MSHIEQLVKQYCPNGVEYKELGEIAEITDYVANGSFASLRENVKYKDKPDYAVLLRLADYSSGFDENKFIFIDENAYNFLSKTKMYGGELILSNIGSIGSVFKCPKLKYKMNLAPNTILVKTPNNDFYYHYFLSREFQQSLDKITSKSAMPKFNKTGLKQIKVPVPPLPVQEEIVKILDAFTSLEAELEAELEARKKQYEYYRNQLLSFDENTTGGGRIKFMQLGDVCSIKGRIGFRGYTRDDLVEPHQGAISLSPANIVNNSMKYTNSTYVSWEKYNESPEIMIEKNDVVFCKTGSTIGKVSIIKELPEPATINPQLVVLKNIKCNPSYLSYILASSYFQGIVHKIKGVGSVPTLSQKDLANQLIPIPPLDEQERIVAILDKFDSLVNDISEGLPAEINARKQQYKHYRNQLLTFDEAA